MSIYNEFFGKLESVSLEDEVGKIEVPVSGGTLKTVKVAPEKISVSLFEGEKEKIEYAVSIPPFVFSPVKKGDITGKVIFYLNGEIIAETPLIAENEVEKIPEDEDFWDYIKDIF